MSSAILLALTLACLPSANDVRIDIGAGPSFQNFPGPIADLDPWVTGVALEACASVPASVAREKAPARWKSKIPSEGEIDVRPLWLTVIPTHIVASPGGPLSMWGATWDFFGIGLFQPIGSAARLKLHLQVPELWWLRADGPATSGPSSEFGIAAAPRASLEVDPLPWLRLSGGWTHHVGIPMGSIHLRTGAESPWEWGSAWFMIHIRPRVKI